MIRINIDDIIHGMNTEINKLFVNPWRQSVQDAFELFINQNKCLFIRNLQIGLSDNAKCFLSSLDIDSCLLMIPTEMCDIYDEANCHLSYYDLKIISHIFDYELFKNGKCPKWRACKNGVTTRREIEDIHFGRKDFCKILLNHKISICPYCNLEDNYLGSSIEKVQFDHYYPKSRYPFLAVCLSNLIPSCKVCNSDIKENMHNDVISLLSHAHPYFDDIDQNVVFGVIPDSDHKFRIEFRKRCAESDDRCFENCKYFKIIDRFDNINCSFHQHVEKLYDFIIAHSKQEICDFFQENNCQVLRFLLRNLGYCERNEINITKYGKISRDLLSPYYK